MALSEVRAAIVTALSDVDVPVHAYPPGTVAPPAIVLVPSSPYYDPGTGFGASAVGIDVRVYVNSSAGPAAMQRLDDLVDAVVPALISAGVAVSAISAPTVDPDSAAIVVDIPTSSVWEDD